MNDAPFADRDVGELLQRDLLAAGRGDEDVADRSGSSRYLRLEPDDEVELLLLLHDLGRGVAADRGLDQAVDVVDVDAVAGDLGAVDLDREARLAELLDQRHVADAADMLEHVLDRLALLLERVEVGAEDLDLERALEPVSASSTASSAGWV